MFWNYKCGEKQIYWEMIELDVLACFYSLCNYSTVRQYEIMW
jgi:hypothetical protein